MLIALSFAEVASRFDGTGGLRAFAALRWWMLVHAGGELGGGGQRARVVTGLLLACATGAARRAVLMTLIIAFIAAVNVRGIRQSSLVVNLLTLGKLLPFAIFIVAGVLFVDWTRLPPRPTGRRRAFVERPAAVYAFGGYEVIPVLGGEHGTRAEMYHSR